MRLKVSSAKGRPFCLGLNELIWHRMGQVEATINQKHPLQNTERIHRYVTEKVVHQMYCDRIHDNEI